jgi:hippurate hydrolase
MKIDPMIAGFADELTEWRRDIHAHPELGFEEQRTSALVAERLRAFGCEVATGIGRTGVVGTLRVGNNPRAIALRADMDALPMQEANGFGHRSQTANTMHACGHDATWPPPATSTARCISSSSRPRRVAAGRRR